MFMQPWVQKVTCCLGASAQITHCLTGVKTVFARNAGKALTQFGLIVGGPTLWAGIAKGITSSRQSIVVFKSTSRAIGAFVIPHIGKSTVQTTYATRLTRDGRITRRAKQTHGQSYGTVCSTGTIAANTAFDR